MRALFPEPSSADPGTPGGQSENRSRPLSVRTFVVSSNMSQLIIISHRKMQAQTYGKVLPCLQLLHAIANVLANLPGLLHCVVNPLPQARGIFLGPQDVDIVGKLAVIAQQGLQFVFQLVLKVLERRVVSVAGAALAGLEAVESVVCHGRGGSQGGVETELETRIGEYGPYCWYIVYKRRRRIEADEMRCDSSACEQQRQPR